MRKNVVGRPSSVVGKDLVLSNGSAMLVAVAGQANDERPRTNDDLRKL
jgi:hypothetical protein